MMKHWIVFCSFLMLLSCTDLHTSDYIKQIDQLEGKLTSIEDELANLDTVSVGNIRESYGEFMDLVEYSNDTLDFETAIMLDEFLHAMGKLEIVTKNMVVLEQNLTNEATSLSNLKSDISNAFGNRSKYNQYIINETARVDSIVELFNGIKGNIEEISNEYESKYEILRERFDNLVDTVGQQ